jgi:alcohol dehydrogenase
VPDSVPRLVSTGFDIVVERGARTMAWFDDSAYAAAGAQLVSRFLDLGGSNRLVGPLARLRRAIGPAPGGSPGATMATGGVDVHSCADISARPRRTRRRPSMKALVFQGPGEKSWTDVPDPVISDPRDAIIRVDTVTICGTDLHILAGDVPAVQPGCILGHEAVGTVMTTGSAVNGLAAGDRVLASCISACGTCQYCRQGSYGQCRNGGGWILGHLVDGVQAQYARLPFADLSTYKLPSTITDEAAVLLADILPTSYEVGVLNGGVRPGDTVVIVGAGPIGLAAILTAKLYSPSHVIVIDKAESRLQAAKMFGADVVLTPDADPLAVVGSLTGGLGADVVMEAVGTPATFELCMTLVRPGGRVANIGVHGKPATLHLEDLWIRNITLTTGLVDTYSTPRLLTMLGAGQLDVGHMITHRFPMDDFMQAYEVFGSPATSGALKVVLSRS